MTETIAFVGLGNMGVPMSRRLVEAGYRVLGADPSAAAQASAAAFGVTIVKDAAAAAAASDVLILMLPNSDVVETVLLDDRVAAALRPGARVIDMSSSEPVRTRTLAGEIARRAAALIDAPVSGGVRGAREGTLTVMAGGDPADVDAVSGILATFGRVRHVGPTGSGHALKALNNLLSATHLWATSEAVLIAERFGVSPAAALDVVNGSSGRSGSSEAKWPSFILPGTYDSGFSVGLMAKDVGIAVGLMEQLGLTSDVGRAVLADWCRAADDLGAAADHTEVARWISERLA
ncbi:NAD(P)-dependent oxidoreductase [Microbacterium ulmi]|uniref:NAD(P)-dependent oxidoreductase n=1 Tax=Microbacterium ulmi TaxID=179095 RepID=UPI001ABAE307|nr:NAD(P)-dependent oxidoreductase [Microbacterium ulmi]NII69845.1 3-hydroxyisobutyrate dehydrogenase [Microbacterium ulmi]